MYKNKTIGVILATYNGETFLREQIKSLTCQTVNIDEVIISDGGSTDNTIDIVTEILDKNRFNYRILKSEKKLNVIENFEKAYRECNCDYIFFCDQDDVWIENKIEITLDSMIETSAVLAFTDAYISDSSLHFDKNSSLWKSISFSVNGDTKCYSKFDEDFIMILLKHNVVTGMCMCVDSAIKEKILPFSKYALHDKWIAMMAILSGNVIAVNTRCVYYRQHNKNANGVKRSIAKTICNYKKYYFKLCDRQKMILDVIERNRCEKRKDFRDYFRYLSCRISFINGEDRLCNIMKLIGEYKKYEINPLITILKDVFIRLTKVKGK